MIEYYSSLPSMDKVYLIGAALGGTFFLFQLVLQFLGGDMDIDDIDVGEMGDVSGEADSSFRWLSFQGLTSFFMMFGLGGLALSQEFEFSKLQSLLGATVAGCTFVWIYTKIHDFFLSMQASGTMRMENAIGQEGTAYLTIPAEGAGKVRVAVQNRLKVFNAVTSGNEEISTGEPIRVVRVTEGNVLVVEKVV